VFDYAAMLAAYGNKISFVILSSSQESCVCWLDDKEEEATNLASHPEQRYKSAEDNSSLISPGKTYPGATPVSASPPTFHSPPQSEEGSVPTTENAFSKPKERTLLRSKIYGAHKSVDLLYSSILCALKGFDASRPLKIYSLPAKLHVDVSAIRMTTLGYTWGRLKSTIGKSIVRSKHPPSTGRYLRNSKTIRPFDVHDDGSYYIIGEVGRGSTSKAFHALDAKGHEVVIKMFVKTTDKDGEPLNSKKWKSLAKQKAKDEFYYLDKLYPKLEFHNIMLSDFSCIVMPLLKPVLKQDRVKALKGIEDVYKTAFAKKGLKYTKEDVRWRHIGTLPTGSNKEEGNDVDDVVVD
jgi:hypothetical protein